MIQKYPASKGPGELLIKDVDIKKKAVAANNQKKACAQIKPAIQHTMQLKSTLKDSKPLQDLCDQAIPQLKQLDQSCTIAKMMPIEDATGQKMNEILSK